MKAFIEKEHGYILSRKRGDMLRKDAVQRVRQGLRDLWLLGKISKQEQSYLDFELDKILYKEVLDKDGS